MMIPAERRRSARISVFQEEAAVIHANDRDLPVKVVDLSSTGALVSLLDMPGRLPLAGMFFADGERLQLSMHDERSVFQIAVRVVRTAHEFIAVEFLDKGDAIAGKIQKKLLVFKKSPSGQKAKGAGGGS
jgi:c-di-GMP-binding flagellar brake protein YcgR